MYILLHYILYIYIHTHTHEHIHMDTYIDSPKGLFGTQEHTNTVFDPICL